LKEIDNVIELGTNTDTERLSFATRYASNCRYGGNHLGYTDFTFDVTALSNRFCGTSHFCVRNDQLEKMCTDLGNMQTRLSGTTRLDDNESDAFIEFVIESRGRLNVIGQIGGTHEDNFMKFQFHTDQTAITQFVQGFKVLLCCNLS